ncbi:MAG: PmoA family protein [Bacteroidota bacterium]|nr:PmoA family protein [Bacteroidota bacterium]
MSCKKIFAIIFLTVFYINCKAQRIATIEVALPKTAVNICVPVQINLDAITFLPDSVLNLMEKSGENKVLVNFQIENGNQRTLNWLIEPKSGKSKYVFELIKGKNNKEANRIQTKNENGSLIIENGTRNLVSYVYKTVMPPKNVDTAFRKSGFIHPLWSPGGQVLTRIQAPDHYHHYGIWDSWAHTIFEGDSIDFWNLRDKKGTVRCANVISSTGGPVFGQIQVLEEYVAFKKNHLNKVALNQMETIRVYQPKDPGYYIMDVTLDMSCASSSPVLLQTYRYGGLGWRTTEQWNNDNCEILTSEGRSRKDADNSCARWIVVQGNVDNDYAGALMMSYPGNFNHPEPLRIWPLNTNRRGDMYANFTPVKNKDWVLIPGHSYVLKYRFVVFNGHLAKEKAESAWTYYSALPKVTVTK